MDCVSLLDLATIFLEGQNRTSAGPIRCNGCILGHLRREKRS